MQAWWPDGLQLYYKQTPTKVISCEIYGIFDERALHVNLLKIALHHCFFFQRTSPQVQNSNIEKCILMAASEYKFILEIFLNGCFSKAAAKIYLFQKFFTHIVHFLLWCHFKEEQVLMIFFSKGFGTKCKYTELALNFNQNSILVKKTHFPFILVE